MPQENERNAVITLIIDCLPMGGLPAKYEADGFSEIQHLDPSSEAFLPAKIVGSQAYCPSLPLTLAALGRLTDHLQDLEKNGFNGTCVVAFGWTNKGQLLGSMLFRQL